MAHCTASKHTLPTGERMYPGDTDDGLGILRISEME